MGRKDLEAAITRLEREVVDPRAGIYGPGSQAWRVDREAVLFLGGGRAALLQLAHPMVAHAVDHHSTTRTDPQGRFARTFQNVFAMIFGELDDAVRAARRVHNIHTRVTGQLSEDVGVFARGTTYHANDADALMWVHATLMHTAVLVYETVVGPLSLDDKRRYYTESRRFADLFGIPEAAQPRDWDAFVEYFDRTVASERIAVGTAAGEIGRFLLEPPRPALAPLAAWYRTMTAGLMPARLREPFGLSFGAADRAAFAASIAGLRAGVRVLPRALRYQPAYVQARRRLAGKSPDHPVGRWVERLIERALTRRPASSTVPA